jgi:hypothetical protein
MDCARSRPLNGAKPTVRQTFAAFLGIITGMPKIHSEDHNGCHYSSCQLPWEIDLSASGVLRARLVSHRNERVVTPEELQQLAHLVRAWAAEMEHLALESERRSSMRGGQVDYQDL